MDDGLLDRSAKATYGDDDVSCGGASCVYDDASSLNDFATEKVHPIQLLVILIVPWWVFVSAI